MEKKKNIIIGIVVGVLVIGLFIATMFIGSNEESGTNNNGTYVDPNVIIANAESESKKITKDQMKDLNEINIDKYLYLYASEELDLVLLSRPTCPYCQITDPIIRKLAKDYDLTINYLNSDNFSDDDKLKFIKHNEKFAEGFGTPMLLVVGNNSLVTYVEGLTDTEHFLQFFKENNFIKE